MVGLSQVEYLYINNNNNNNDKVYTPLSEKCSQSRVFISKNHHNVLPIIAYQYI